MKRFILAVSIIFLLVASLPVWAANDTNSNPTRIDTFGADVTVGSGLVRVEFILVTAYSSAKTVTFIDADSNNVAVWETPSGESTILKGPFMFTNGLVFDDSASDLAAGDFIFVFK